LVEKSFISFKYILVQTIVLVLIVAIPLHFYINSEIENSTLKDKIELKLYAQKVANKIYKFSNSDEKEFYFPRSNIFKSAIFDQYGEAVFSLIDDVEFSSKKYLKKDGSVYLHIDLKDNVFGATHMIVTKKITYAKIIQNVLAILIVVAILVLISTFFIIKQSLEPYKKFNQYLENFIKDAMHELKTPMGVILLNLDGLDSIYENNKMIKRAKSALKNMVVIYEDLEFFVRKNRVEHLKENINISNFTKERIDFFMDLISSKNMFVELDIYDDICINFSKLELSRIIDNTISNAIKYSKNATTIKISLQKIQNIIVLKIKDEGRGIKDTKKIFDRYYRGDKISGGFGIGLSIVKKICENNNVFINVESIPDRGTVFIYNFENEDKI